MNHAEIAKQAWEMMVRDDNPMPPGIARDWLMDNTEPSIEGGAAVQFIAFAAKTDALQARPSGTDGNMLCDCVGDLNLLAASSYLHAILTYYGPSQSKSDRAWIVWAEYAQKMIDLLRELQTVGV